MDSKEGESVKEPEVNDDNGDTVVPVKKYTSHEVVAALFNGLGVGLLLGTLLGLAVSPVVTAFIGTLSSLLVLLLGLNEKLFTVVKSVRIGAFGFFAVVGILLGFYVRSYSPLAPSLTELKNEYTSLGYDDTVAKELLLYQEFGLVPESWTGRISLPAVSESDAADGDEGAAEAKPAALMTQNLHVAKRNNVLFSSTINIGDCYQLESSHDEMSFAGIRHNFSAVGGTWKELAENMDESLPDEVKVKSLLMIRDVFCANKKKGTVKIECPNFTQPIENYTLPDLKTELSKTDAFWKDITTAADAQIDSEFQQKLYISLIKTFCHE